MMSKFLKALDTKSCVLSLGLLLAMAHAPAVSASDLPVISFTTQTGLNANKTQLQTTWNSLQQMGTTQYLGGMIGGLKIDESALLAGALTIGATDFDHYLRTGKLNTSTSNASELLSKALTSAAGINMSSIVGSYTSGGGAVSKASIDSGKALAASGGVCDPAIGQAIAKQGIQHVQNAVTIGLSAEYGFSKMPTTANGSNSGGFAALGCLDKLFASSGVEILFNPPNMSMLTNMLSNWACPQIPGVKAQVEMAFGDMSRFDTSSDGGFYPLKTYAEANDGPATPGKGANMRDVFGEGFVVKASINQTKASELASINSLFK